MQIAYELSQKDSRIIIHKHEQNKGLSQARNTGIKIAKGEFIFLLDSDDYLPRNALTLLYNSIFDHDFVVGKMLIVKNNITKDVEYLTHSIDDILNNNIIIGNKPFKPKALYAGSAGNRLYRREYLVKNNVEFIDRVYWEDMPFSLEAFYYAKSIGFIDKCVYFRTIREDEENPSITQMVNPKIYLDRDTILDIIYNNALSRIKDEYYVRLALTLINRMYQSTFKKSIASSINTETFDSNKWLEEHTVKYNKYKTHLTNILLLK